MRKNYIWGAFSVFFLLLSCKQEVLFKKEMYKNVVALISTAYYNTFEETVSLSDQESIGYISVSCGGTYPPDHDIALELVEDTAQLNIYNWSLFDADQNLYAKALPKDKYELEDYKIIIKAGERNGKTKVTLRANGLSPDSVYFIGLKIADDAGIEVNPKKNSILYQVLIKNEYASQANDDLYTMNGFIDETVTAGNIKMFPLTKNKVRISAGTESFEANLAKINRTSIVLEVTTDNHVLITPYKDIDVVQIDDDPDYPNLFKTEESFGRKFNVFLLAYYYTIDGVTHYMQEELRMEVKEK